MPFFLGGMEAHMNVSYWQSDTARFGMGRIADASLGVGSAPGVVEVPGLEWLPALSTFEQAIGIAERLQESAFAAEGEAIVTASLLRLLEALNALSVAKGSETELVGKPLFHRLTEQWVNRSRICGQARRKPHGYAGDYQLIDWIHSAEAASDDVVGRGLDQYFVTCAAAHAVRNRRSYLVKKILERCTRPTEGQRVVSIGSGPGAELRDLAQHLAGVELIGLDHEPAALHHMSSWMRAVTTVDVKALRVSAAKLLSQRYAERVEALRADVLFSPGVFDYFNDEVAVKLMANLYAHLRPGGVLIIGNFKKGNPSRLFMEWILDWHVIHRSREDMTRLMSRAGIPLQSQELEEEALGVNMFALAHKA